MIEGPFHNQEDHWIAFGDFLTNVVAIFLTVAVFLFLMIGAKQSEDTPTNATAAGNIIIEIGWVSDADVDTWAMGPDGKAVGYSAPQGKILNLLRDDLGHEYEALNGRHYENVYSRGVPAGTYTINVHLYRKASTDPFPQEVEVAVRITTDPKNPKASPKEIIKNTVRLMKQGQETTVVQFQINKNGEIVDGSVNQKFKAVRNVPKPNDGARYQGIEP